MKDIVNLHDYRLKSIAFTKFVIAHTLLGVKIRVMTCLKEKKNVV